MDKLLPVIGNFMAASSRGDAALPAFMVQGDVPPPVTVVTGVDDVVADSTHGMEVAVTVLANDTLKHCPSPVLGIVGDPVNAVAEVDGDTIKVTPQAAGEWSVVYNVTCDGTAYAGATIEGDAKELTVVEAVADTISGSPEVGSAVSVAVLDNDDTCDNGEATTIALVAGSEKACTAQVVGNELELTPTKKGDFSAKYEIVCNGVATGKEAKVSGTAVEATVIPVVNLVDDKVVNELPVGKKHTIKVTENDEFTICDNKQVVLKEGTAKKCTVEVKGSSSFEVTPTEDGKWEFKYYVECDGTKAEGEAKVSGTAKQLYTATANPDDISGSKVRAGQTIRVDVTANDTPCDPAADVTAHIVEGTAVNCTAQFASNDKQIKITPTAHGDFSVEYTLQCNGQETVPPAKAAVSGVSLAAPEGTLSLMPDGSNGTVTFDKNAKSLIYTGVFNPSHSMIFSRIRLGDITVADIPEGDEVSAEIRIRRMKNKAIQLSRELKLTENGTVPLEVTLAGDGFDYSKAAGAMRFEIQVQAKGAKVTMRTRPAGAKYLQLTDILRLGHSEDGIFAIVKNARANPDKSTRVIAPLEIDYKLKDFDNSDVVVSGDVPPEGEG